MSYKESKMMLNKIRDDYACKGEVVFRCALQYAVECGHHLLQDPIWVQKQLDNIDVNHDEAEKEGKVLFITRDFEKSIVECAVEISKIPTMEMLQYVQKEVWLSGEGIDYQRAIGLLKNCMEWLNEDISGVGDTLEAFHHIGFDDCEIEEFGYGWLFEEEE